MNEKGSITLEAVVALPLVLVFGFALSLALLAARTEAALREAVDEAVQTTAAHMYPVGLLTGAYRKLPFVEDMESAIDRFMPYSIKVILQEKLSLPSRVGGTGTWNEGEFHRRWAEPFVMSFVDRDVSGNPLLDRERLVVTAVQLPTFVAEDVSYFGIAAEYRMTLPIPFAPREIVFTAVALERCWVGDKVGEVKK